MRRAALAGTKLPCAREFPYNHWRAVERAMKVTNYTGLCGRLDFLCKSALATAPGREFPLGKKKGTRHFAVRPMKTRDREAVIPVLTA